jgi:NAD(P)-dependent dehydrogenase (short-subunit alcohol dehydrogenase family)
MDVDLAVVTGGAGGLGRLITQQLAERGLCVVIADTDHAAATQLVTELVVVAGRSSWTPTLLTQRRSSGS